LADRQHHQKALSPSSIELREGINLGIISSCPFFNQGRSLQLIHHHQRQPAIVAEACARTAVEHSGIIYFESTQQIGRSSSITPTSPNKSWSPPLQTHLRSALSLRIRCRRAGDEPTPRWSIETKAILLQTSTIS
jgi:hypothetical protein